MIPESSLAAVRAIANARPEICALYLFGSQATGEPRPGSDVDFGVLHRSRQPLAVTLEREEELARALGRHVDLVDAARAPAFLALDIVRGERIFCRDPLAADRFELYVLRRAGDLLPFERERQALLLAVGR